MTYSVNRTSNASDCAHQVRAPRSDLYTALSSVFGRNRSTFSVASCTPRLSDTASMKRSRSFLDRDRMYAWVRAMISTSSGDGSGRSGTGSGTGTTQGRPPILNIGINARDLICVHLLALLEAFAARLRAALILYSPRACALRKRCEARLAP